MRYRVAAIFAGLALVVALLAGLTAGVRFGTALFRAIVGSAVFAGLGIATVLVLERYLPELVTRRKRATERGETSEAAEAPQAPGVDIMLPEENPLVGEIGAELESEEEAVAEPLEAADAAAAGEGATLLAEAPAEGEGGAAEEVDALPSLGRAEAEPRESPAPARPPAAGAGEMNAEPSEAARVLRTWLKRDHEG